MLTLTISSGIVGDSVSSERERGGKNGLVRRFSKKMLDLKRASLIYYHKYVNRVIKLV